MGVLMNQIPKVSVKIKEIRMQNKYLVLSCQVSSMDAFYYTYSFRVREIFIELYKCNRYDKVGLFRNLGRTKTVLLVSINCSLKGNFQRWLA